MAKVQERELEKRVCVEHTKGQAGPARQTRQVREPCSHQGGSKRSEVHDALGARGRGHHVVPSPSRPPARRVRSGASRVGSCEGQWTLINRQRVDCYFPTTSASEVRQRKCGRPGFLNGKSARFGCPRRAHSAPPCSAPRARAQPAPIMERARVYATRCAQALQLAAGRLTNSNDRVIG